MLSIESIRTVAQGLEPLGEEFVFVGGSVAECYATSSVSEQARPTNDIDVVVELTHYGRYSALQEKLIHAGFNPDRAEAKVIKKFKDREEPYLNSDGQMVRWKFESIEESYHTFIETNDEFDTRLKFSRD